MADQTKSPRQPTDDDYRAAGQVMRRRESSPPGVADQSDALLGPLASLRAEIGAARFDLLYGLRPPRDYAELLSVEHHQGKITSEQMRERLKADAERPVDVEMLRAFSDCFEDHLQAYGAMLQTIVEIATDQCNPDAWRRREPEVDQHVDRMMAKLPLWKEQLRTVLEFLTELRASSGQGPVRLNDASHSTAHMLAAYVMDMAAQGWRGCQEIAHRSRDDDDRGRQEQPLCMRAAMPQATALVALSPWPRGLILLTRWRPAPAEAAPVGWSVLYAGEPLSTGHPRSRAETIDPTTAA